MKGIVFLWTEKTKIIWFLHIYKLIKLVNVLYNFVALMFALNVWQHYPVSPAGILPQE